MLKVADIKMSLKLNSDSYAKRCFMTTNEKSISKSLSCTEKLK